VKQDYHQLLQPDIMSSVSGLSLISRVIVDGYLSGFNRSRRVGPGLEFSQYRGYEPGDDMRLLDWKMLARSGRYYIKQAELDTHISVKFILDASKSMLHTEGGLSKMEHARVLVAALADLAQRQGDAVGLYALNDNKISSLAPAIHKQHLNRFFYELLQIKCEGKWPENLATFDKLHNRGNKELLFFITDLYEDASELTEMVKSLKTSRNEVVVFHIMGKRELEFDYSGYVIFEDLETGNKLKVDTKDAKSTYLNALSTELKMIREFLLSNDIDYHLFDLSEHIAQALQVFLKKRSRIL